jgi:hypothetical protein
MATAVEPQSLPHCPDEEDWTYLERTNLGAHGACDLIYRVPVWVEAGPALPSDQAQALPLLLHEFDRQEGLAAALDAWHEKSGGHGPPAKGILRRLLPRLLSYRYSDVYTARDFIFDGYRPSSLHVLSRVLETDFRFRLEDLSHFATHAEFLITVLNAVGLPDALDPAGILYAPAVDSPFPFKFAVVGHAKIKNRETYVSLLKQLLRKTESDEVFRSRNFMELIRGFAKFGPAAATPEFQEVELRIWRVLSYLAARLRVKAGRLTDAKDEDQIAHFLAELRQVHDGLDALVHLPGRMAAFYRTRFDLELSGLHEHALTELDAIAKQIDCSFDDMDRSIDVVASTISEFRRLGSASPLETLEGKDRDIKLAYGDEDVEPLEHGWARTYSEQIFTGAQRFDTRRYDPAQLADSGTLSEEEFSLDVDLSFGFGGGGSDSDSDSPTEGSHTELSDLNSDSDDWDLGLDDIDFGV